MSRELRQFFGAPLHQQLQLGAALGEILGFALFGAHVTDDQTGTAASTRNMLAASAVLVMARLIQRSIRHERLAARMLPVSCAWIFRTRLRELRHGPLADVGTDQVKGRTRARVGGRDSASLPSPPAWRCSAARPARGPCVPARRRSRTLLEPTQRLRDFVDRLPGRARGMRHRPAVWSRVGCSRPDSAAAGLLPAPAHVARLFRTCRLTSSSLRCPSSAATNRPSTVASSSATSVIWRAAAEFMVDDRGTSLSSMQIGVATRSRRRASRPNTSYRDRFPERLDAGVSSFRAQHRPRLPGAQRRPSRKPTATPASAAIPIASTADHARNDPPPRALPRPGAAPVPHRSETAFLVVAIVLSTLERRRASSGSAASPTRRIRSSTSSISLRTS